MNASIFNIQRYSLHDGGGIRSIVFFKGCPFRCPWCCNPESLSVHPQLMFKKSLCIQCSLANGVCTSAVEDCPTKAKSMIGEHKTIDEIMDVLIRDKVFYETSNGGITLSGGEVLLQQVAALELLSACKKQNLHTAIESTLALDIEQIHAWAKLCDRFLIDLKIMNPQKAKEVLGIDIHKVKENIKQLIHLNAEIIIRIPIVPTYTDSSENITGIISFMHEVGLKEVHLLPYHNLGESKYKSLNLSYSLYDAKPINDKIVEDIRQTFIDANINACIYGN